MSDSFSNDEKVTMLFKKSLGYANTKTDKFFFQETTNPEVNRRPIVFSNQIWSDELPSIDDFKASDAATTNELKVPGDATEGYVCSQYPHIVRYDKIQLEHADGSNGQTYKHTKLIDSIPASVGYGGITVYSQDDPNTPIDEGSTGGEWLLDNDCGILSFYHNVDPITGNVGALNIGIDNPPLVSFYRYEGKKGGGSGGGSYFISANLDSGNASNISVSDTGGGANISFHIDGNEAANISRSGTTNTLVVNGHVRVIGNLDVESTVTGNTTIISTSEIQVNDKNITLGVPVSGSATDTTADGGGITIKGATDKEFKWNSGGYFSLNDGLSVSGALTATSDGILQQRLTVGQSTQAAYPHPQLDVYNSGYGSAWLARFTNSAADAYQSFVDFVRDGSTPITWRFNFIGSTFKIYDFDSASTPQLAMTSGGLVGIGTDSPLHKLDVRVESTDYALRCSSYTNTSTGYDIRGLLVGHNSNENMKLGYEFRSDGTSAGIINVQGHAQYNTNSRGLVFQMAGVEKASISPDGSVHTSGGLSVAGAATLGSTLSVAGEADICNFKLSETDSVFTESDPQTWAVLNNKYSTVSNSGFAIHTNSSIFSYTDNFYIAGSGPEFRENLLNVNGGADIFGAAKLRSTLSVAGAAKISGTTTLGSTLSVAGPITMASAALFSGGNVTLGHTTVNNEALSIGAPTTIQNTLSVSGDTTFEGLVGIGTASPLHKLDVKVNSTDYALRCSSYTNTSTGYDIRGLLVGHNSNENMKLGYEFRSDGTSAGIINVQGHAQYNTNSRGLVFQMAGVEKASISPDGSVHTSGGLSVAGAATLGSVVGNLNVSTSNGGTLDTLGSKTFIVTVDSLDPGSNYYFVIDGNARSPLTLAAGRTYVFDQSDPTNAGHPLNITYEGDFAGAASATGVTAVGTAGIDRIVTYVVPDPAPASAITHYFIGQNQTGMGSTITFVESNSDIVGQSVKTYSIPAAQLEFKRAAYESSASTAALPRPLNTTSDFGNNSNVKYFKCGLKDYTYATANNTADQTEKDGNKFYITAYDHDGSNPVDAMSIEKASLNSSIVCINGDLSVSGSTNFSGGGGGGGSTFDGALNGNLSISGDTTLAGDANFGSSTTTNNQYFLGGGTVNAMHKSIVGYYLQTYSGVNIAGAATLGSSLSVGGVTFLKDDVVIGTGDTTGDYAYSSLSVHGPITSGASTVKGYALNSQNTLSVAGAATLSSTLSVGGDMIVSSGSGITAIKFEANGGDSGGYTFSTGTKITSDAYGYVGGFNVLRAGPGGLTDLTFDGNGWVYHQAQGGGYSAGKGFAAHQFYAAAGASFSTGYTGSDRRVKRDITDADLSNSYNIINQLALKNYSYTPAFAAYKGRADGERVIGFIADEVEALIPHAINQENDLVSPFYEERIAPDFPDYLNEFGNGNGIKTVDQDVIFRHLVGAVQVLQARVEALETQLASNPP